MMLLISTALFINYLVSKSEMVLIASGLFAIAGAICGLKIELKIPNDK